jgi:hypothetical protein
MKRIEGVELVSAFLEIEETKVWRYFDNINGAHIKYGTCNICMSRIES